MKAMKLCRLFAQQIVAGRMFFSEIAQRFKDGVKAALKEMGREDLATDSNARAKDEKEDEE